VSRAQGCPPPFPCSRATERCLQAFPMRKIHFVIVSLPFLLRALGQGGRNFHWFYNEGRDLTLNKMQCMHNQMSSSVSGHPPQPAPAQPTDAHGLHGRRDSGTVRPCGVTHEHKAQHRGSGASLLPAIPTQGVPLLKKASPVLSTLAFLPSRWVVLAQGTAIATQCPQPAPATSLAQGLKLNGGTSF